MRFPFMSKTSSLTTKTSRRARPAQKRARIGLELLEDRLAPALIVWTNRSDFDNKFGPNTAAARVVIDQAIDDWMFVIDNFNYRNIGQAGWSEHSYYTLTVGVKDWQAVPDNAHTLARGGPDKLDGDGKPWSGHLTIDDNAAGSGWYFDPNPAEDFEFTTDPDPSDGFIPVPLAPYDMARLKPAGAPSDPIADHSDLYSVVLHEVGHALGFDDSTALRNHITNHFVSFNDGTGATFAPGDVHTDAGVHPNDLMNPAISNGERRTISDLDARILAVGLGYSVRVDLTYQRSFISTFDSNSRQLTVWGDLAGAYDDIRLDVFTGGDIFTIVNGRAKRISQSAVQNIFVNSRDGNDDIRIGGVAAGQPVLVSAGRGENFVYLSYSAKNLSTIQGNVNLYEDGGRTNLNLHDENNDRPRNISVNARNVAFSGSDAQVTYAGYADLARNLYGLIVRGGFGGNSIDVAGFGTRTTMRVLAGAGADRVRVTSTTGSLNIDGVDGNDQVTIGSSNGVGDINGLVFVSNSAGFTDLTIDHSTSINESANVRITDTGVEGLAPASILVDPSGIGSLTVRASNGWLSGPGNGITVIDTPQNRAGNLITSLFAGRHDDTVNVLRTSSMLSINGESGNDTINIGQPDRSVGGQLIVDGGDGTDVLIINDQATFANFAMNYSVTPGQVTRERVDFNGLFFQSTRLTVTHVDVDAITLNAGICVSGNVIDVGQTDAAVDGHLTVNGGAGLDVLFINDQGALEQYVRNDYTVTATEVARARRGFIFAELTVDYAGIEGLALNAAAVSSINVTSLPVSPVTLNLGSAATSVTVGQADAAVDGKLTVNGGGNLDVLTINDQAILNPRPATYAITSTEVARERRDIFGLVYGLTVDYTGIEGLTLNAGAAQDYISVLSTAAGAPVTLSPGLGDDTVNVGGADNRLDGIQGALTILDGVDGTLPAGFDHNVVNLHDEGNATADFDYTMSDTALARAGIAPIILGPSHYDQIDVYAAGGDTHVIFAGAPGYYTRTFWYDGMGNDRVDVLATPFGAFLDIFSAGGNDVFRAGSASQGPGDLASHGGTVENIQDGAVYFASASGSARAVIDDSGDTAPRTASIYPHVVGGLSPHNTEIRFYYTVDAVIYGGSGGNTFSLLEWQGVGNPVEIYAGSGDDTINFNQPHSYPFQSHTFGFHGQGGTDTFNINDQSATDTPTWDIGPSAITRTARSELVSWDKVVTLSISDLENVNINGGSGNDTFRPAGVAPGLAVRVNGGDGSNTLDYSAVPQGVVVNLPLGAATGLSGGIANIRNVNGGSGNDILVGDAAANTLRGGGGRDLLIGGLGADLLDGGADDDLLIGGWTDYDTNAAALNALLTAWAQPLPYHPRIENITDNGIAYSGGAAFLNKGHVHDDLAADLLTGGLGQDWFFRDRLRTGLDTNLDLIDSGPDKESVIVTRN